MFLSQEPVSTSCLSFFLKMPHATVSRELQVCEKKILLLCKRNVRILKLSKGTDICKGSALSSRLFTSYCTYTHIHRHSSVQKPNTPSHEASEEDQEMMKQLHALYKTPRLWSDPHPPPRLSLLLFHSYFSADTGRKCASLKMKHNKQMRSGVLTSLCNPPWNMTCDGGVVLK